MSTSENSLHRSIGVFEKAAETLKHSNRALYLLTAGLALLAEGLLAKSQKMESRLAAIEGALRLR